MPLTTFDEYKTKLQTARAAMFYATTTSTMQGLIDLSTIAVPTPAIPTTSVAYNKSSDRAINRDIADAGTGRLSFLGANLDCRPAGTLLLMVDILNMSGGMSGIVTGAQTTGLPTAALTRYTDGEGVFAGLVIHGTVGSGGSTFTAEYTNQAGTGGRVSTAYPIGGAARFTGHVLPLPVQGTDSGIRAVANVNIAGTTGAAGNIGVVLFKPLAAFIAGDADGPTNIDCISTGRMVGQFAEVLDDACLAVFAYNLGAITASGSIFLGET